jgi:hypothetical protein
MYSVFPSLVRRIYRSCMFQMHKSLYDDDSYNEKPKRFLKNNKIKPLIKTNH